MIASNPQGKVKGQHVSLPAFYYQPLIIQHLSLIHSTTFEIIPPLSQKQLQDSSIKKGS